MGEDGKIRINGVPDFAIKPPSEKDARDFQRRQIEEQRKLEKAWTEAGMTIASAVEKPFNDFIDTAEKLVKDEAEFDLKTDEEVANYLLNNIYIGE